MHTLFEHAARIHDEADKILYRDGLHALLESYGDVYCTGSYQLNLMHKKDLDLSLVNPHLDTVDFIRLGTEVAALLNPHSMHYRNTRIKPVEDRPPESLYWGFLFRDWNIDLWLVPPGYYEESVSYLDNILSALDDELRQIILALKAESLDRGIYGRLFSSKELYRAVIQQGVRDLESLLASLSGKDGAR